MRSLEWLERHENVVVCGPSGIGNSHFLEALGHTAIDHGAHVGCSILGALGHIVRRGRADDSTGRAIKCIMRADVIVIDDIGLLPVAAETADALDRVVDAAYEKCSIALSSNLRPAGFDELMPETVAHATVDRLLDYAHVVIPPATASASPSHRPQGGDTPFGVGEFDRFGRHRSRCVARKSLADISQ